MSDNVTILQIKGFPLIKFQSEEKIRMFQQGLMYMKTLEYYRKLEKSTGDNVVGDSFEASLHINEATMMIPELGQVIEIKDALFPTSHSNDFVFCMFGINPNAESFSFTEEQRVEISNFGDTALLITDKDEFFRRVFAAANRDGLDGYCGFVKYYDEHIDSVNLLASLINGMEKIAFWKRDIYRYQQEFRFLIHKDGVTEDYIKLEIGDISDISKIVKSASILNPKSIVMKNETESPA